MLLFDLSQLVARKSADGPRLKLMPVHKIILKRHIIRSNQAFTAVKFDKIFSGYQPYSTFQEPLLSLPSKYYLKNYRRFRNRLLPHHQNLLLKVTDVSRAISVPIIRM
jgi:hypothetical protein